MRRVILIGATGFFGRRLADRLATIPEIALVVTSRDEARARHAAEAIQQAQSSPAVSFLAFERDDVASLGRLRQLSPWLVIDASGPFQSADYRLARAVLDMGAHWIDLADARDYLLGFEAALDELARSRGARRSKLYASAIECGCREPDARLAARRYGRHRDHAGRRGRRRSGGHQRNSELRGIANRDFFGRTARCNDRLGRRAACAHRWARCPLSFARRDGGRGFFSLTVCGHVAYRIPSRS